MNPRWSPSVTVAAVIEHAGRYLLVEEHTPEGLRLNNPAGHLEPVESPLQAVVRETLEETARVFTPTALVGIYLSRFVRPARADRAGSVEEDVTYLRFAYAGTVGEAIAGRALDEGIVRTLWLTLDEIESAAARLRSPMVLQCIHDHRAGRHLPMDTVVVAPSLYVPEIKA